MALIGLGIASLIISTQSPVVNCGFKGSPPLRNWVFGTGIACVVVGDGVGRAGGLT